MEAEIASEIITSSEELNSILEGVGVNSQFMAHYVDKNGHHGVRNLILGVLRSAKAKGYKGMTTAQIFKIGKRIFKTKKYPYPSWNHNLTHILTPSGEVKTVTVRRGFRGRPAHFWSITGKGIKTLRKVVKTAK